MIAGVFISFEGIDGAGKSSHIEGLAQALRGAGREVVRTREPGGTPLAEQVRVLLLHERMDALTEALLAFAARRDHLRLVIAPALARGAVVLCDRFTDATFAYQGAGHGCPRDSLSQLELMTQAGITQKHDSILEPDLTLWFDLPPAIAAERLAKARAPDRFEAQPLAFFERVAQGYAERAAGASARFARIDAALGPEQVSAQVLAAVAARGWLSRSPDD